MPLSPSLSTTSPCSPSFVQTTENYAIGDRVLKVLEGAVKDLYRLPPSLPEFMTVVEQGKYKILSDSPSLKVKCQALYTENIKCCIGIGVQGFDSNKQCISLGLAHLDLDPLPVAIMLKKMAKGGVTQIQGLITGGHEDRCDKKDKESFISEIRASIQAFQEAYPKVTLSLTEKLNPYKVTEEYEEHERTADYFGLSLSLLVSTSSSALYYRSASLQFNLTEIELIDPFTKPEGIDKKDLEALLKHADKNELVYLVMRILKAKCIITPRQELEFIEGAEKLADSLCGYTKLAKVLYSKS